MTSSRDAGTSKNSAWLLFILCIYSLLSDRLWIIRHTLQLNNIHWTITKLGGNMRALMDLFSQSHHHWIWGAFNAIMYQEYPEFNELEHYHNQHVIPAHKLGFVSLSEALGIVLCQHWSAESIFLRPQCPKILRIVSTILRISISK